MVISFWAYVLSMSDASFICLYVPDIKEIRALTDNKELPLHCTYITDHFKLDKCSSVCVCNVDT